MTKVLTRMLFTLIAAAPIYAQAQFLGPPNEFTVNGGAWYLYKRNCSGCHGLYAQGIHPIGTPLRGNAFVVNAEPAAIAAVIRNGRKDDTKRYPQYLREAGGLMNMPPFDRLSISDSELDTLVAYLKGGIQQGKFNKP